MVCLLRYLPVIVLSLLWFAPSHAASLRVAPTTLDLVAPEAAATLKLRNEADHPINVQIRVFRWTQSNGADHLEPTSDVVASPPFTRLRPNGDYVVRIVRLARKPVVGEEAYRVVVDELPNASLRQAGLVQFVLRFSVPVFFRSPDATLPRVTWIVRPRGKTVTVIAANHGQRHLRIASLRMKDGSGRSVMLRAGLVGYVLGEEGIHWSFPVRERALSGHAVTLSAESQTGQINAHAVVQR